MVSRKGKVAQTIFCSYYHGDAISGLSNYSNYFVVLHVLLILLTKDNEHTSQDFNKAVYKIDYCNLIQIYSGHKWFLQLKIQYLAFDAKITMYF